jgi:hypothetical protein
MRRRVRAGAFVVATSLAACGDAPESPRPPGPDVHDVAAPVARGRAAVPSGGAVEALSRLLDDWNGAPRDDAPPRDHDSVAADVVALGESVLPTLVGWLGLDDEDPRREFALAALAGFGERATPALVTAIREGAGVGRVGAILALLESDATWRWEARGPDVARALLAALGDAEVAVRAQALVGLGKAGPTGVPVAEAVAARLASESRDEVENALDALLWLAWHDAAGAAAVPILDRIASGAVPRETGFRALSNVSPGSPEAAARLAQMLHSGDTSDRACAIAVLDAWGPGAAAALPELLRLAEMDDDSAGISALGLIARIPGAVEAEWRRILRLVAPVGDSGARDALIRTARTSPEFAARLRDAVPLLSADEARIVLEVLDRAPPPGLDAVAVRLTTSPDPALRFAAVATLCDSPDPNVDPAPLRTLLDDADPSVRAAAAAFLAERDPAARERAVAVARALAASDEARPWVTRALLAAADPAAPGADLLSRLLGTHVVDRIPIEAFLARSDAPLGTVPNGVLAVLVSDAFWDSADRRNAARAALRCEGGADALMGVCAEVLRGTSQDEIVRALDVIEILGPRAAPLLPDLDAQASRDGDPRRARLLAAALRGDVAELASSIDDTAADVRRLLALGDEGADAFLRRSTTWATWRTFELARELEGDATLVRAIVRAAAPDAAGGAYSAKVGAAGLAAALGPERGLDVLARLAGDADGATREAAARSLSHMATQGIDVGPAALALRALLADAAPQVRGQACRASRDVTSIRDALRRCIADPDVAVRTLAAAEVLRASPGDAEAKSVLFASLRSPAELAEHVGDFWWSDLGEALAKAPLVADDAAVLGAALRAFDACDAQGALLTGLARLGADAAPALVPVRLALAGVLSCIHGMHGETPNRAEAVAVLAAMGAAARPALPDLRSLLRDDDAKLAESARRAIAAIESAR